MAKKTKLDIGDFSSKFGNVLISPDKLVRTSQQVLRTGSVKLDLMLRGGFRAGTISELYGPEGGAKTTIALHTAKEVLANGGTVLYMDLEHGLDAGVDYDEGHLPGWMEKIGINPNNPNFHVARPLTGEEVYDMIEAAIVNELFDLVVLDSMAAMVPRADMEGNVGESAYGKVAKLNSEALKRVLAKYEAQAVQKTHLMVINQARDSIGTSHAGMRSPGGRALRHFAATRLRCTRVAKKEGGINVINVRVDKNRFSPPWESTELFVHPAVGLDLTMELIQVGVETGVIVKGGAWFTISMDDAEEQKVQGANALRKIVDANPTWKATLRQKSWSVGLQQLINEDVPEDSDEESEEIPEDE